MKVIKTRFNPFTATPTAVRAPIPPAPPVQTPARPPARRKKRQRTPITAAEALARATNEQSLVNYPAIYDGFARRGLPMDEIKPRENVFTFKAWMALGRVVKKGEHGIKIPTVIPVHGKETVDPATGEPKVDGFALKRMTTVFHISQTIPLAEAQHPAVPPSTAPVPVQFPPPAPAQPVPIRKPATKPDWRHLIKKAA